MFFIRYEDFWIFVVDHESQLLQPAQSPSGAPFLPILF